MSLAGRWWWPLGLALGIAWVAVGCRGKAPNTDRPFFVLLDTAAQVSAAAQRARTIVEAIPSLEGASALTLRFEDGGLLHGVASRGFAAEAEARALAAEIAAQRVVRLDVLDLRRLTLVDADEVSELAVPDEAEALEPLLAALPPPGGRRLDSFRVEVFGAGGRGSPLGESAAAWPPAWRPAWNAAGWRSEAQATYSFAGADGRGELRLLIGWLPTDAGEDAGTARIKEVYNLLLAHVRAPEGAEEPQVEVAPAPRVRKRKRVAMRRRKVATRQPPPPPPEPKEPPTPVLHQLPWGRQGVVEVTDLELPGRLRGDAPRHTAWITYWPEQRALAVALFDERALADYILTPAGLGKQHGIAHEPLMRTLWQMVPEATAEGESLVLLGMERLSDYLPAGVRRAGFAVRNAVAPVLLAGFRSERAAWQMAVATLAAEADAAEVYEQGLVEPRQKLLLSVADGKRKVKYDIGVALREIGDVQGWHMRGAAGGRLQEVYFRREAQVWLVQAAAEERGGLRAEELLARLETLPIWDQARSE